MWLDAVSIVCFTVLVSPIAGAQSLAAAKKEAHLGRVDAAVIALHSAPKSAEGDFLLCRLYASIERYDQAIAACEAATAAQPTSSAYALALARAYGAKADHASAMTGLRMVGRIRANFERAVQLDGANVEALSDLGQFYVEAPSAFGGGLAKARALVPRLQTLSPARALRLSAMIASKAKDNDEAEQQYRAEIAVARSPEAYVDLANYYRGRKNWEKAAANAKEALTQDAACGPDVLDAAGILIVLKRNVPQAQTALRCYGKAPQGDVASYAKADVMLGNSLQDSGDVAGARVAYQAAVALAAEYEPARQGLAR